MCSLPVVVSPLKELSDTVTNDGFGFVLPELSVNSLNKAIDNCLNVDLTNLSENARKFAKENCWETQEPAMISSYYAILNQ